METDPRSELFEKVINLVSEVDLKYLSLEWFTEKKAKEILETIDKSDSPEEMLFEMLVLAHFEEEEDNENDSSSGSDAIEVTDLTESRYGLEDVSVHAGNVAKCIAFLNDTMQRFLDGEAVTMTAVSLLKDGRYSLWVPDGFSHDKVQDLFDPVIEELKKSEKIHQLN